MADATDAGRQRLVAGAGPRARRRAARGRAVRLRPGRDLRRARRHAARLQAVAAAGRGRHELGDARRARRARSPAASSPTGSAAARRCVAAARAVRARARRSRRSRRASRCWSPAASSSASASASRPSPRRCTPRSSHPPTQRGRFVSAYQLAITIGIFLSYLVDQALADDGHWRIMLGVSAVPGGAAAGRDAARGRIAALARARRAGATTRARRSCARGRGSTPTCACSRSRTSLRDEPPNASWARGVRAGVAAAAHDRHRARRVPADHRHQRDHLLLGQASSPRRASRRRSAQTQATTWAIGAVNVARHADRDRLHRQARPAAAAARGTRRHVREPRRGRLRVPFASARRRRCRPTAPASSRWSRSWSSSSRSRSRSGPVVWTVINEIFPGRVRGRAVAVATAVNWGAAFVVSEFFLTLVDAIGEVGDVLAVRVLLRRRRHLDLAPGAGDQGPLARADRDLWSTAMRRRRRPRRVVGRARPRQITARRQRQRLQHLAGRAVLHEGHERRVAAALGRRASRWRRVASPRRRPRTGRTARARHGRGQAARRGSRRP